MDGDQKKLWGVVALCGAILIGGEYLIQKFRGSPESSPAPLSVSTDPAAPVTPGALGGSVSAPTTLASLPVPGLPASREAALLSAPRIAIVSPTLSGSLSLKGATIDDLSLTQYQTKVSPSSTDVIRLLTPPSAQEGYQASWGWSASSGVADGAMPLPDAQTVWRVVGPNPVPQLSPETPVTLAWDNGKGLEFQQEIRLDPHYLFSVTARVINTSPTPVTLSFGGTIQRRIPDVLEGNWILYEGPLGVLGGTLKELGYDALKTKGLISEEATTGWLGFTDKYWLVAFAPEGVLTPQFGADTLERAAWARACFTQAPLVVAPGEVKSVTSRLFAGPKILSLLDAYEAAEGIHHFDLAVDFGWFYFLTKPIFYALTWLKGGVGNFGLAILLFTVFLKLLFFPLANRAYHSMARMKKFQPQMAQLKIKYKDDPARMNQEVMALYKREKINPASGCLPMLLQVPFFFALYKVLFISIEMRHAPFFGWIQDLSAPDPTNLFTLFGLLPFSPPSFLHLGLWPLLMGASMFLQQRLNPPPADPVQRVMFTYVMPLMFTFMLGQFAAGLVIYWTWNNLLSVTQQWIIMRRDAARA